MEMLKKSKKRIGQNVNSPTEEKPGKILQILVVLILSRSFALFLSMQLPF